jgi:uncharacterized protein DUF5615
MHGLLADANCEGHLEALVRIFESPTWNDVWQKLGLTITSFEELSLDRRTPDRQVWQICQERQLILITRNRNKKGEDSLETAIRELNQAESLPVITLASADRIMQSRDYAQVAAEELMDYLLYADDLVGTGRLWVPRQPVVEGSS